MDFFGGRSDDARKELIAAVYSRPALWNPQHPQYANLQMQDRMLEEISYSLRTSRLSIEREWNVLLAFFRQECEKYRNHCQFSRGDLFRSNWPYFEMMSFLKDQMLQSLNESVEDRFSSGVPSRGMPQRQSSGDTDFRRLNSSRGRNFDRQPFVGQSENAMRNQSDNFKSQQSDKKNVGNQPPINERNVVSQKSSESNASHLSRKRQRKEQGKGFDPSDDHAGNKTNQIIPNAAKKITENSAENISKNNVVDAGKDPVKGKLNSTSMAQPEKATDIVKEKNTSVSDKKNEADDEHDCDDLSFFRSLLPYMKSFPRVQKLKLRNKIQQIILDELEMRNSLKTSKGYVENNSNNESVAISKEGSASTKDEKSSNNTNPMNTKSLNNQQATSSGVAIPFLN